MSKVTLHSKLTAVSSKPVGSGKTHTLSGLDHAMGFHTLHIIFYYHNNDDNLFRTFELDPLRESLSKVLTTYPTVTGRLVRGVDGNWEVKCNDAGVRVIKANVDTTIDQWLSSASGSQEAQLIAWDDMPEDPNTWSPFRIQINSFEGGGVAIGLSCSHMLADLTFAASLFKSWTEVHRHLPITHPPFLTPIRASPLPNGSHTPNASTTPMSPPTRDTSRNVVMATATFKFPSSIINRCLSKLHGTCPNATPFDFLSALFWTRIVPLKPPKSHGQTQTHTLSICTDFRSLIKPSLPIGYFGNALHFSTLSLKAEEMEMEMESGQLGGIASLVHSHVAGVAGAEEEIWSSIEGFESQKESSAGGGKFGTPNCMYGTELTCVCMEHMVDVSSEHAESLLYAAMFSESEKPAYVSCHVGNVDGEGLIMVMPSPEGGLARTVMVMLPEDQLAKLSNDHAILQLEPTVILAGCGADRTVDCSS